MLKASIILIICCLSQTNLCAETPEKQIHTESIIGSGWAGNSVNTVIFRKNSILSSHGHQYLAYYNKSGKVILARRKSGSNKWEIKETQYSGNIYDAHNSISIMADGDGFLHVVFDQHNTPLKYAVSKNPESLQLSELRPMLGNTENFVTYPEFYRLKNGDLLFLYREGISGNGKLLLNRYSVKEKKWARINQSIIDGGEKRSPYWQLCLDENENIHLTWSWRESADVSSNTNINYAVSKDYGKSWQKTDGSAYQLPINFQNSDVIAKIPPGHDLINQTAMTCLPDNIPLVSGYWRDKDKTYPEYRVLYKINQSWIIKKIKMLPAEFNLSGKGTKSLPLSRPLGLNWVHSGNIHAGFLFRHRTYNDGIVMAYNQDFPSGDWMIIQLYQDSLGDWEPTCDSTLWENEHRLHLFIQKTRQIDGEGISDLKESPVKVLEFNNFTNPEVLLQSMGKPQ